MKEQSLRKIYFLLVVGGAIVATTFIVGLVFAEGSWTGWWFANVMHFVGGFYAFFFVRTCFLYTKSRHQISAPPATEIMLFIAGALIMGVFWEWYQLLFDRYRVFIEGLPSLMTYADNIGDLFIDTLGAMIAGIYFWKRRPKQLSKLKVLLPVSKDTEAVA